MSENEQGTLQEQLSELDTIMAEANEKKVRQKKKKKKYILAFSIVFLAAVAALLFALFSPSQQLKRVLAEIDAGGYNDPAVVAKLESFNTDKGLPLKEPDKSYYEAIIAMNAGLEYRKEWGDKYGYLYASNIFGKLKSNNYKDSKKLFDETWDRLIESIEKF